MNDPRQLPRFLVIALGPGFFLASICSRAAPEPNAVPSRLRIGVVQMALAADIAGNRERIVSGIASAAERGVRVVVFPEGALQGRGNDQPALVDEAIEAIRRAARGRSVYVLFGGASYSPRAKREINWMYAIGPDGTDVFCYDKLYDLHDAKMPGVFQIDRISCSAFLCADRWLRGVEEIPIQQGAQISFELSCNFANEWVEPYQWYWYAPRALRNNVWVVFANTGNKSHGFPENSDPRELRHGHSAIIGPDGHVLAASRDDVETIVVAEVDVPMKFAAVLDRDEDGMWVVECPSIPGCVSQGKTREEALANIKEAIALCLEVRSEQGMPLTIETQQVEVAL